MNNLDHNLKPELFARTHITKSVAEPFALAVQREAAITIGNEPFAFVEKTETEYERRTVVTGPMSGDLVKIHEGLKAGKRVVG